MPSMPTWSDWLRNSHTVQGTGRLSTRRTARSGTLAFDHTGGPRVSAWSLSRTGERQRSVCRRGGHDIRDHHANLREDDGMRKSLIYGLAVVGLWLLGGLLVSAQETHD